MTAGRARAGAGGRATAVPLSLVPLAALLLALPTAAAAQAQRPAVGVRAGGGAATFAGQGAGSPEARTGFLGGLFLALPIAPGVLLQPEALYVQKGVEAGGPFVAREVHVDYVQLPLLAKLRVPLRGRPDVAPVLLAGPALAFEAGCRAAGGTAAPGRTVPCEDRPVPLAATDYGVILGAGADLALRGATLAFDVRYDIGLRDIDASAGARRVRNRMWAVTAGLGFPLGRR